MAEVGVIMIVALHFRPKKNSELGALGQKVAGSGEKWELRLSQKVWQGSREVSQEEWEHSSRGLLTLPPLPLAQNVFATEDLRLP